MEWFKKRREGTKRGKKKGEGGGDLVVSKLCLAYMQFL